MHDDEERFPRISLWQLLAGLFGPVANFWLWDCFFPPEPERKPRKDATQADNPPPHAAPRS